MITRPQDRQLNRLVNLPVRIPSSKVEYVYCLAMLYGFTKDFFGGPGLLGSVLMLGIAAFCLVQLHACARTVYAPIALLIGCVITFLMVQVAIHDVSILNESLRPFIFWLIQLIIVQSLCLRPGFSLRYPLVLFFMAVPILPFIEFGPEREIARGFINRDVEYNFLAGGALGEFFGFFTVYFAILGLQAKRSAYRIGAWLLAVGCLFVVAVTVSRSPLLGVALAITVGFRRLLKRGFIPALVLIILVGIVYETGVFEQAATNYQERAMEETGRGLLWPAAIERIFSSPLVTLFGVGEPNVYLDAMGPRRSVPPHNAFLHFALSSGVVPFAFFLAFWIQAAWRSVHAKGQESDAFRIPFLLYTFVLVNFSDGIQWTPWALIALSVAVGSAVVHGKQRLVAIRVGNKIRFGQFPEAKSREIAKTIPL